MAFRTLSRMITTPGKTSVLAFTDGLTGKGTPMIFAPRNAPKPVRQMAVAASTGETAPEDSSSNVVVRRDSSPPATRGPSGLRKRGPRGRNRGDLFLDIWDPLFSNRSLKQMLDTVERLFDNSLLTTPASPSLSSTLRTPWDVMEDENAFRLRFDMPGLSKDEVQVFVEDGDLVIKGEPKAEGQSEDSWASRSYGVYYTRLTLPDHVKVDEVKAELKNGVLHVVVPKSKEEPKKHAIPVEGN